MAQPGYGQPQQEEKYAKIGGILILIGSIFGLLMGALYAFVGTALMSIPVAGSAAGALCYIPLVFSLIGIVGGVMAIKKQNYMIAILGGILGLLSVGFVLGFILCLIGVILVGISKQDFQQSPQPQQQEQGWQRQTPQQQQGQTTQQQQEQGPQQQQAPQQQPPQEAGENCPDCGQQMRYIDDYDRWYCDNCQEYK